MNTRVATIKTWCLNNLIVMIPLVLVVALLPIALVSFGGKYKNKPKHTAQTTQKVQTASIQQQMTNDGRIIYDIQPDISMPAGSEKTFLVPFGTRVDRYNTEGTVVELTSQGRKYTVTAKTNASFDLVWTIEKGYEHLVKPRK